MQAAFGNTALIYDKRPLVSGPLGARELTEECARSWQAKLEELFERAGDNGTARLRSDFTFVFKNGMVVTVPLGRWVTFFPKVSALNTWAKNKKGKRSTEQYAVYGMRHIIGSQGGRFNVTEVSTPPVFATRAHFRHLNSD